ncbi:TonB-dependent receptor [Pseudoalteromonas sp. T1lg65]|uniref:TonB-dependent receptor n=1 Tax=Pseudoalteromonas sp. T1lg65 TaxID=2077101 RepID=UPI003F7997D0
MKLKLSLVSMALMPLLSTHVIADDNIETIVVTGDFQKESVQTLSASASIFDQEHIDRRGAQYLDEILAASANVNFSAGASRGRFLQIRGVGLRSQFVDPIYPSVGLIIDGINYSGLGQSALLFDAESVVIYRGPQGTKHGSDALAGLVEINTPAPSMDNNLKLQLGAGNYGSYEAGIAAGTGLTDDTAIRASFYQRESDGYMDNLYLEKPTQTLDEQVTRLKLNSQLSQHLALTFSYHHINTDNGYDGFTLDNSRRSVADEPGSDQLESDAFAVQARYTENAAFDVDIKFSGMNADTLYSYDEDWTCNDASKPQLCAAGLYPDGYSSTDAYRRKQDKGDIEVIVQDKKQLWVVGGYAKRRDIGLSRDYTWLGSVFSSDYSVTNTALFGQYVYPLSEQTDLITGLRVERYSAQYHDSNAFNVDDDTNMWGGKLALEYRVTPSTMIYTSLTRGYKIGGVNGEALAKANDEELRLDEQNYNFDPEYLWNIEFGVKGQSDDQRQTVRVTTFYMHREDIQLKQWQTKGVEFAGYFDNAGSGSNYGIEVEGRFQYTDRLGLTYSAAYLNSEIKDFVTADGLDLNGAEQAQSPNYQYSISADYALTDNLVAEIAIEGKDEYFFSSSHREKASSHNLINASLNYFSDNWSLRIWGRNLADDDVAVRGFRFGNDPLLGYQSKTYVQYGEPRVYGVTFSYEL